MTTTNVLAFYKGTALPIYGENHYKTNDECKDTTLMHLRLGKTIQEIRVKYLNDITMIEGMLYKHCNPSTEKGVKRICKILDCDREYLIYRWYFGIGMLLCLRVIKNDDMNGYLMTQHND